MFSSYLEKLQGTGRAKVGMEMPLQTYISPRGTLQKLKAVKNVILALIELGSDTVMLTVVGLGMMIAGAIWLIVDRCGIK